MQLELLLLVISILFFVSILADKAGYRLGVPALLLFLVVGMIFGSDGAGIEFENINIAQTIGTVSLCIILFSGGMDTKINEIRPVMAQGISLATIGVLLTAFLTGVAIWLMLKSEEISFATALLIAATMSSTDSASVFSILRSKGLHLKHNLRPMLELESGSNDPMAYVLTITLIGIVNSGQQPNFIATIGLILMQLIIGGVMGFVFGKLIVWAINKLEINNTSLYPILVLTCCIFIFSATFFMKGNSFLAVYIGGLVIGNNKFVHKRSTMKFFDGLSWLCQLLMFLTLGLLVNPRELIPVAVPALVISFIMIFITRPLSVFACLMPFRKMSLQDKTFVSWVGLRGAVPIIFAIMAMSAQVPYANLIFNIVFFCTLVSLVVQGISLPQMGKWLKVTEEPILPNKLSTFDIEFPEEVKSEVTELVVAASLLQNGNRMMDLGLPESTLVIMVKREQNFFVPTGKSILKIGDVLLIITDNKKTLSEVYAQLHINTK